jgi:Sulfatase
MAKSDKPNILVIWGDDIGVYNVSAYHRGLMGGSTPNIDRIANEGILFTDHYAQQSCTAGRASFIMGQHPFRTGMLTIGMPGSKQGIQPGDITIAEALKPLGYGGSGASDQATVDGREGCQRQIRTARAMFLTRCSPPSSRLSSSFPETAA